MLAGLSSPERDPRMPTSATMLWLSQATGIVMRMTLLGLPRQADCEGHFRLGLNWWWQDWEGEGRLESSRLLCLGLCLLRP